MSRRPGCAARGRLDHAARDPAQHPAPLIAEFGLRFCFVFLTISALSFLGVGIQPPTADWGSMVRENATLITYGDVTPLLPAGAIALLTVAVNFVVDWFPHKTSGLRDEH
jgi:peptide/nickel transport system permease protein